MNKMVLFALLALLFGGADAFVPPPRISVTAPSTSKISAAAGITDYLSSLDSNPQAQSVSELLTTANFKSSQRWRKRTKQVSVSISRTFQEEHNEDSPTVRELTLYSFFSSPRWGPPPRLSR